MVNDEMPYITRRHSTLPSAFVTTWCAALGHGCQLKDIDRKGFPNSKQLYLQRRRETKKLHFSDRPTHFDIPTE